MSFIGIPVLVNIESTSHWPDGISFQSNSISWQNTVQLVHVCVYKCVQLVHVCVYMYCINSHNKFIANIGILLNTV